MKAWRDKLSLDQLKDTVTPGRLATLERVLAKRQDDLTVVLENVHDAHNASAVLRSCDAVGIRHVNLVYYGGQVFPDLARSSSASARKWVDQRKFSSVEECYQTLRSEGFLILTTSLTSRSESIYTTDFTRKTAIVFGNEHVGVSELASTLADGNILIPQVGMIESLNISVACAVTVYEAFRQRLAAGKFDSPTMAGEQYDTVLRDWLGR